MQDRISRRRAVAGIGGVVAGLALTRTILGQDSTPEISPGSSPIVETGDGAWTYTDVLGTTVTLSARPVRIAANLVTAAALWDLGIRAVAVFDWTASNHPDGDHIAWGNVDPTAVANVGDVDGNILAEDLLLARPDVILTLTFNPDDPAETAGVVPDLAEQINTIAPVLVVTDMAATDIQLERLVDLGASLGADLETPETVAAKSAYDAKVAEFRQVAAEKSDLTSIFANVDADAFYVGGPQGVAELQFLNSLGLVFANADSTEIAEFWETLSLEQALKYPADVFYNDVYSAYKTTEELQAQPVIGEIAAIKAGQVGLWERDFPVSYAGVSDFLETILAPLRTANKVS